MAKPEGIDEDFLLASIGDKKEGKAPPVKKEKSEQISKITSKTTEPTKKRHKRNEVTRTGDYEEDFLCKNELNERKSIYVSDYVHDKISRMIKRIGGNELSVGGYIDNVLKHHLVKYKDIINTLYKLDRDDLLD